MEEKLQVSWFRAAWLMSLSVIRAIFGKIDTVGGLIGVVLVTAALIGSLMWGLPKYQIYLAKQELAKSHYDEERYRRLGAAMRDYPQFIELEKVIRGED